MTFLGKVKTVWLLFFSLSVFFVVASYPIRASGSDLEVELEAELSNSCPTCTPVSKLKGEAGYEKEFSADGIAVKEAEIEAKVQIPIPNNLGIDASNANGVLVVLELSKTDPNLPYATCTLAFKKASGKSKGAKAMYALKVQTKLSGTTHVPGKKQIGSCTLDAIDLNVQSGDTAMVTANGIDVLSGIFGGEDEEED
jgi:hypothetical protein